MKVPMRYLVFCLRKYCLRIKYLAVFCCFFVVVILTKILNENEDVGLGIVGKVANLKTTTLDTPLYLSSKQLENISAIKKMNNEMAGERKSALNIHYLQMRSAKIPNMKKKKRVVNVKNTVKVDYNVHIFYYAWYENIEVDGAWQHWNHEYLQNWQSDSKKYPRGFHQPPDDIGSNFYPKLGCYSSRDPKILDQHMKMIHDAGIGVLIVSWYPPGKSDGSGRSSDSIFSLILDFAAKYELKVTPHFEPYKGRTVANFRTYLKYFANTYGNHSALYKKKKRGVDLTVYYIYDSYLISANAWKHIFGKDGKMTVRKTPLDGIFLALLVNFEHRAEVRRGRFDGFYTYFASIGFTYGSSWKNWKSLAKFACTYDLMFIPSVGPGYIDTRVRPWNLGISKPRRNGIYYDFAWKAAIDASVDYISITSFNEWHEGTQIEPAVPKSTKNFTYLNYEPDDPEIYLLLTKYWINQLAEKSYKAHPNL